MSEQKSPRRKKTLIVVTIAATVLALGTIGTVAAQKRGYDCGGGAGSGHRVGFNPAAVEQLGLSEQEMAKFEELRDKAMDMRGGMRASFAPVREAFQTQRNSDDPDLRAVVQQARAAMEARHAERQALIDEGLAFYDTLSPEQKRQVMDMLSNRFDRFGAGMHRGGRGGGHGHGGHRRGWDDDQSDSEAREG